MENVNMNQELSQGIRLTTRDSTAKSERESTRPHKMRDNIIQEEPWTLTKMLERHTFIDSYPWPSTVQSHSTIARLQVPQDLVVNGLTSAPFNNFMYWNGTIRLKFQVIGSPLTQGCLVAFFVPLTDSAFIESNILPSFSSVSVNQAVYLFANANTSADMEIPFNSVQGYLNIADTSSQSVNNTLGYVYIAVMNPLSLSTGTPDNVAVSVFSQFVDNEFKVPRRTGVARQMKMRVQSDSRVLKGFMDALTPENIVGDAIDIAANIFGMDNPIDPGVEKTNKVITTQRMNFGEGIEYIDKLSVNPAKVSEVTSDTFATVNDEMNMDFLKTKYSYLGSFFMTTANSPGDILASFPLNPCPNAVKLNTPLQIPLLQYLAIPFQLWKGSLSYKIQVVSTSMQTAKIFASFNYGEYTPSAPGVLASTTSQYGEAFEINQGSNTYEFTVPYVSITPELYVPSGNKPTSYNSLGMLNISVLNNLVAPSNAPTTITFNVFIAGGSDFTLTTLSASNNLLPYRLPTSGAQRRVKRRIVREESVDSDIEIITDRTVRSLRLQSAAQPLITPASNVDLAKDSVVAPPTREQTRLDVSQARVTDIRKLLKKYHMHSHVSLPYVPSVNNGSVFTILLSDLFGFSARDPGPFASSSSYPIPALWATFQSLYRQFKGSINFKIMVDDANSNFSNFSVFFQPPTEDGFKPISIGNQLYVPTPRTRYEVNGITSTTWQATETMTRLPITYSNGINRTAEFSVPYSSRFLSVINGQIGEADTHDYRNLGSLIIYYDQYYNSGAEIAGDRTMNLFFSLGDDARFGTLFNVPFVRYNPYCDPITGAVVGPAWPDTYSDADPIVNTLVKL